MDFVQFLIGLQVVFMTAAGQAVTGDPQAQPIRTGERPGWYMLGRVTTVTGSPISGVMVAVYLDPNPAPILKTTTSFQGEFEITLPAESNPGQRLKVVVRKGGYLDATDTIDMNAEGNTGVLDLVLRGSQEADDDPDLLPLRTLMESVTERLRASAGVSEAGPERGETLRAAAGLLAARDTDGALRLLVQAVDRDSHCLECRIL